MILTLNRVLTRNFFKSLRIACCQARTILSDDASVVSVVVVASDVDAINSNSVILQALLIP